MPDSNYSSCAARDKLPNACYRGMKTIEDILDYLAGSNYFTVLDMTSGYHIRRGRHYYEYTSPVVSEAGIEANPDMIDKIINWTAPHSRPEEVRKFL
ncbi:hypothetical protein CHS0354_038613 [Potamilus streckersoni]|uniref:Uncharacterized protein n=1 Tax=Potamilus streckersoni TaxID=2493646 RepID=A0AAE0TFV9_9BIVA|nr:hypothetical protein CHS0354_038613 [Potamilus streckersoni]